MSIKTVLPTQAMVVAGLSAVINDVCCGAYAITRQCTDNGDLVFDSIKPTDVPRIINMGVESQRPFYFNTVNPKGKGAIRKSPFFQEVGIVQGISNRAKRFAKGLAKGEREIRRTAVSLAVRADNAAETAAWTIEPEKRAEIMGISAHSAVMSGMLFSMLDHSEDLVLAQDALTAGARQLSRMGLPVAGATAATSAAVIAQPWNRMDDRTRIIKKEAGRMWAQSLQMRDDEATELDRVFLGLITAPRNEYVRLLLLKLLQMHGRGGNWICMSADYLRLGLAVAKGDNPTHEDWFVVRTCVDRALKIWWGLHQSGEMDIDEVMPEVETAEEIALWAGALEFFERGRADSAELAKHYSKLIAEKNDEYKSSRMMTEGEQEKFINQYVPQIG